MINLHKFPKVAKTLDNINSLLRKIFSEKTGAILVEFAFSIPVLITILFFALDGPRFFYIKWKMHTSAHLAVNLMQGISQKRSDGKALTCRDLSMIFEAAFLNYFSRINQHNADKQLEGEYTKIAHVYYVKGDAIENGSSGKSAEKAFTKWVWTSDPNADTPVNSVGTCTTTTPPTSVVKFSSAATNAENICEGLEIDMGEVKIIIDIALYVKNAVDARKAIGFFLMPMISRSSSKNAYFNTTVVFSPKPGIFTEEPPQPGISTEEPPQPGISTEEPPQPQIQDEMPFWHRQK